MKDYTIYEKSNVIQSDVEEPEADDDEQEDDPSSLDEIASATVEA